MQNDERLNRIEERIAWLERHVIEQDRVMLELGEENSRLKKELGLLRGRVSAERLPGEGEIGSVADERPPHY